MEKGKENVVRDWRYKDKKVEGNYRLEIQILDKLGSDMYKNWEIVSKWGCESDRKRKRREIDNEDTDKKRLKSIKSIFSFYKQKVMSFSLVHTL